MKYGLLIGRFQPFHNGHLCAVKFALKKVDILWILIGSAQKSYEQKNPFTAGERLGMMKSTLDANKINSKRWHAIPVNDANVHSLWVSHVDMLIPRYDIVFTNDPFSTMLFKEHGKKVMKIPFLRREILEGTKIRRKIASDENWKGLVPKQVTKIIKEIDGVNRINMLQSK
ncbi:MAG: nicotinamide-nucleotide adenylyltransferase [Nitrososphaerales archaeon]